jgi:hypothetical protein
VTIPYYLLAQIEVEQDNPESSLRLAEESTTILTQVNYGSGLDRIALVKGNAFYLLAEFDKALDHFIFALRYYIRESIYPSLRAMALKGALACAEKNNRTDFVNNLDGFQNIPYQEEFSNPFDGEFSTKLSNVVTDASKTDDTS